MTLADLIKAGSANLPRHLFGAAAILIAIKVIDKVFDTEIPEGNRDIALVILGVVLGWAGSVFQFHYASSDGSKRKDRQIGDLAAQAFDAPDPPDRPRGRRPDPVEPVYTRYEDLTGDDPDSAGRDSE